MIRHPVAWPINTTTDRGRHLRGSAAAAPVTGCMPHNTRHGERDRPTGPAARRAGSPGRAMDNLLWLTLWLPPLPPLPALAGAGRVAVPARFTGHWAGSPDACASDADKPAPRIAPRPLACRESDGPTKAVVVRGDTGPALSAGLSGGGATWRSSAGFQRSADRRRRIATRGGQQCARYRCGAPARTPSHRPSMPAAPSRMAHSPRQETP